MSGDIVERLQQVAWLDLTALGEVADTAATAIAEIERLRAAGDALADNLHRHVLACGVNDGREAMRAWQEARRG